MKLNKNKVTLYIDTDEKYHFIVGEMLKDHVDVVFADSEKSAMSLFKQHHANIGFIILCIDHLDYQDIMNSVGSYIPEYYHLILISQDIDAIGMYDLISIYGADDYLTKPFSRQGLLAAYKNTTAQGIRPFKQRLFRDMQYFNDQIQKINQLDICDAFNPLLFDRLDHQMNHLMDIKNQLEPLGNFPKSGRPNILFIDDEKNIIDVYQYFVEDKPFHSFFSNSLAESRTVLVNEKIDIIILDLGLPDGHGVNLLKEIYEHDSTDPELPDVIVISSYFEKDTVVDVLNAGAKVFINKPMTYKKFLSVIYQVAFLRYMRHELDIKKLDLKKKYVN